MPEHPDLNAASTNLAAWQAYAAERLTSENAPPPLNERLSWCQVPGIGPGAEILGDLTGRRVLEIGCGPGDTSAYLATLGAHVTGIDGAPAQIQRGHRRWQHPRLELLHAEASDYLRQPGPRFDIIMSIFGALDWTRPAELLPLIARRLLPAGQLVFSTAHPARQRSNPRFRCPSGKTLAVIRPTTDPQVWPILLAEVGLRQTSSRQIQAPDENTPSCLIVTATSDNINLDKRLA